MIHYYVEEWRPRRKWFALTSEDRGKFFFDLSPAMQTLEAAGIELVGYVVDRPQKDSPGAVSFLRIWQMPEKDLARLVDDALAGTAWREFFEPGSFRGDVLTSQVAIPHLISPS